MICKNYDNGMSIFLKFMYVLPTFTDYYISYYNVLEGLLFLK